MRFWLKKLADKAIQNFHIHTIFDQKCAVAIYFLQMLCIL